MGVRDPGARTLVPVGDEGRRRSRREDDDRGRARGLVGGRGPLGWGLPAEIRRAGPARRVPLKGEWGVRSGLAAAHHRRGCPGNLGRSRRLPEGAGTSGGGCPSDSSGDPGVRGGRRWDAAWVCKLSPLRAGPLAVAPTVRAGPCLNRVEEGIPPRLS